MQLNRKVFFPTILLILITLLFSSLDSANFVETCTRAKDWTLEYFGWLFTWSTFLFVLLIIVIYFSRLGRLRIGGKHAKPILTKWRWFAIALCSTIATGILFWGMAEPLYHLNTPPETLGLEQGSTGARIFSMSTMYMHWSFTPYGIYTIASIGFALGYYNRRRPFQISTLLSSYMPSEIQARFGWVLDLICLYALIAGMAASLAAGMLAMLGGLEACYGIEGNQVVLGIVGLAVVLTFIVSAASGLQRGIRILSDFNIKVFIALAIFVFLAGPTVQILKFGLDGLIDYAIHFIPRSTDIGSGLDSQWQNDWTFFYWANWFAWAPIASLFLGRLAVGYTVREVIRFHLVYPSLFAILWMTIFSGASIYFDLNESAGLYQLMLNSGEESVMYQVFGELPLGFLISVVVLIAIFISYVTAADSNISAMSAMSTKGIDPEHPEAPIWIKVIFGGFIGLLSWVMLTGAGVDGIRILSVLGGFPAMFIVIAAAIGLVVELLKVKSTVHKDND